MNYSHGVAQTHKEVEQNEKKMETWINPLEARLPNAPDMRIYCLYAIFGVALLMISIDTA
jgi:phospholipid:diacylglycerol acyltransferase